MKVKVLLMISTAIFISTSCQKSTSLMETKKEEMQLVSGVVQDITNNPYYGVFYLLSNLHTDESNNYLLINMVSDNNIDSSEFNTLAYLFNSNPIDFSDKMLQLKDLVLASEETTRHLSDDEKIRLIGNVINYFDPPLVLLGADCAAQRNICMTTAYLLFAGKLVAASSSVLVPAVTAVLVAAISLTYYNAIQDCKSAYNACIK